MTFAAVGTAALTAGATAAASGGVNKLLGGGGGGGAGQPGFAQTINLPTFGFNEPARAASSNFLVNQLNSVGRGELPQFFQNQIPALRRGLDRNLRTSFFGLPGRRGEGSVSQGLGIGALTGLGARSANAQANKQLQNFTQQSQQIDEFIAQQGINVANQVAQNFPGQINAAPQGPPSSVVQFPGTPAQVGFLSGGLAKGLGGFIGGGGFNGFGGKISNFLGGFGGGNALAGNITNQFNSGGGGFGIAPTSIGANLGKPPSQFSLQGSSDVFTNPFG